MNAHSLIKVLLIVLTVSIVALAVGRDSEECLPSSGSMYVANEYGEARRVIGEEESAYDVIKSAVL